MPNGSLVLAARPTVDHDGEDTIRTDRKGRVQWVVHTSRDCHEADIWASAKLPPLGDVLRRYVFDQVVYEASGTWFGVPAIIDPTVAVVRRSARKSNETENLWFVDVFYEGISLIPALARAPPVRYSGVTYQESSPVDVAGQICTNSAGDAYEDGVSRDADRRRVTITRTFIDEDVDQVALDAYLHTRNSRPWQLPGPNGPRKKQQLDENGDPVFIGEVPVMVPILVPEGCAKISQIDYEPVELRANQTPADSVWGWDVTTTIDYDLSKFRDNDGTMRYRRWRDVRADMGYHELRTLDVVGTHPVIRMPIIIGARQVTSPALLNGAGVALKPAPYPPNLPPIAAATTPGTPAVNHNFYSTQKRTGTGAPGMTVSAPGVLGNAFGATGATFGAGPFVVGSAGSVTDPGAVIAFNADGSFTYTPAVDFVGYVKFTFRAVNDAGVSEEATVLIYVGDTPRVRVFERYPLADWDSIKKFLGDWTGMTTESVTRPPHDGRPVGQKGSDAVTPTPTPLQARIDALMTEATARHRARLGDAAVAYAGAVAAGGATGAGRSHLHVAAVSLAAELAKWDRLTNWRAVIRSEVLPNPLGTGGTNGRPSPAVRDAAAVLIESAAWYAASGASDAAWEQLAAAAVMYAGKVRQTVGSGSHRKSRPKRHPAS